MFEENLYLNMNTEPFLSLSGNMSWKHDFHALKKKNVVYNIVSNILRCFWYINLLKC